MNSCYSARIFVLALFKMIKGTMCMKSIIAGKKKYAEELATTAERAAREGNMKQLYDTTKKLSGKYSKPE
ncbi:unnamed protein product [Schistosoma margrebowiei]|uniref:Uncharacterized protein n=1 Tax=Schistosoma margrebowiei TaxID=48269 RepID=A0A183N8R8_9TREM|nr:unnamed protein product [Schistosoma margrebowiei]